MRSMSSGTWSCIEVAMVATDELMLRAHRGKTLRRALGGAGRRPQQKDPVAMPRGPQVVWPEIRAIEIFGERRSVEQAAGNVDADPVIEDE